METSEYYLEDNKKPVLTKAMFEAKDFRIGNWVRALTAFDSPTEVQVHTIEATTINGSIPFDDLEGIKLTPEMMTKYGFKQSGFFSVLPITHGQFVFNDHEVWVELIVNDYPYQVGTTNVRTLHEFQNLFYDLTRKEL